MAEKKAEFRNYLASSGVMDAIVKSMVVLYEQPEKPSDPVAFIANQLRSASGSGNCAEKDKQIAELTKVADDLRAKLGVGGASEPVEPAPVAPPPEVATNLLSGHLEAEPAAAEEPPAEVQAAPEAEVTPEVEAAPEAEAAPAAEAPPAE